jgi:3D (Asp-Asp-Asp) domain-containing protein
MTLLLAPFDDCRQPSAAWNCPRNESRSRSSKLLHQRRRRFSIVAGNFGWLWTLLAALFAISLPALLKNDFTLFFCESVAQEKENPPTEVALPVLSDAPYTMPASLPFALDENPFAPASLSYHANIFDRAKLLLGQENVALLDALQPGRLQLEHTVQFNLGHLLAAENLTSPGNKVKRRQARLASHLARVTVYWPEEGDFYTRNRKSSTGIRLRDGHCAVDPKVIPYGSVVNVPGVGRLIAVDTGGAVISRRAARMTGRTRDQRRAIVIDIFCSTRAKAKALIKRVRHFAVVTWQGPDRVAGAVASKRR